MLSPGSWLHFAEQLAPGSHGRFDHDCGGGRTLKVWREPDVLSAWCHRCSDGGRKAVQEPLADRIKRLAAGAQADLSSSVLTDLPEPRVTDPGDWPKALRLWLYRSGLGRAEIGVLGAYYHPDTDRVVVPVLDSGKAIYWQARSETRKPKWIGPVDKPPGLIARWGSASSVTLCEDMLSAFKVGIDHEGWAILGTSIPDHMIAALMARDCPVNLWCDDDPAGQRSATKYLKQLSAYGVTVRNIRAGADPKRIPLQRIKELLS